ncbi:TPA: hypothetical protein ACIAP4_004868, partial [Salmonella enterica subsp. diarizonae serovar 61:l,v:z35]|nr:hypothetical protein [Salmonella enterica]
MTENALNKSESTFTVQKYKVSGFDIIITTPDGETETIKDGLSLLIMGKVELKDTSGNIITQNDVISTIKGETLGLDTVYLGDKLEGNEFNANSGEKKTDDKTKTPTLGGDESFQVHQQQLL